jgi:hypothetical protein
MKTLFNLSCAMAIFALAGCATDKRASLDSAGTRRIYSAHLDPVWRSTLDAIEQGGLRIYAADRNTGRIDARRLLHSQTWDENVSFRVTSAGVAATSVEVTSRQAGAPASALRNRESDLHQAIAANLARAPVMTLDPGLPPVDPLQSERERVRSSVPVPATPTVRLREAQLRYNELIAKRDTAEGTLLREADELRRVELQRELDRLREEIRLQQERVHRAERDAGRK